MNHWPAELEGACYEPEHGWFHPIRQPSGRINRAPIPLDVTRAAGLEDRPELADGVTTLVLRNEPLRNLIPRS
jgi:hypothetical protein